jgi:hypothetical protein
MVGICRRARGVAGAFSTVRDDVKSGLTTNEDTGGAHVTGAHVTQRSFSKGPKDRCPKGKEQAGSRPTRIGKTEGAKREANEAG